MSLKRLTTLESIKERLVYLESYIKANAALRHQDVYIEIESFFRDLLNLVYGWELVNANTLFGKNQDSFDLADNKNRIAVQVTVTTNAKKIRKTLNTFVEAYDDKFDRIIFMYPVMAINKSKVDYTDTLDDFDFDASRDRLCFRHILQAAQDKSISEQDHLLDLLQQEITLTSAVTATPRHTLPSPSLNKSFKGRRRELLLLTDHCSDTDLSSRPIVITGTAGVGKTQLAVEFGWQRIGQGRNVFFVQGKSAVDIDRRIANLSKSFPELEHVRNASDLRQFDVVIDHLRQISGWTLIIDGVDDEQLAEHVVALSPQLNTGQIVVTSQLSDWLQPFSTVDLKGLGIGDCVDFFQTSLNQDDWSASDNENAATLAKQIHGLPVWLEQAVGYMNRMRRSLAEYLGELDVEAKAILSWHSKRLLRYPIPVIAVWNRTLSQLGKHEHAILKTLSHLGDAEVSDSFVYSIPFVADDVGVDTDDYWRQSEQAYKDQLANLAAYSLIQYSDGTVSIHGALQFVTRLLTDEDLAIPYVRVNALILARALSVDGDTPNLLMAWHRMEPHVKYVVEYLGEQDPCLEGVKLTNGYGVFLNRMMRFSEAEHILRQSVDWSDSIDGVTDTEIGSRLSNLAKTIQMKGRGQEAVDVMEQALRCDRRAGVKLNIAMSLYNIADILGLNGDSHRQGMYLFEARDILKDRTVGSGYHRGMLESTIAEFQAYNLGNFDEAWLTYWIAIQEYEQSDCDRPDYARALRGAARLALTTDRNGKAAVLLSRAIMSDLKRLFPFQDYWKRNLRLLIQLSTVYGVRRDLVPKLTQTISEITQHRPESPLETRRGDKFHRLVIQSIGLLTGCLSDICIRMSYHDDADDACSVAKTTSDIDLFYFGPESQKYASDLVNLAMIKFQLGDVREADSLCEQAIEVDAMHLDDEDYQFCRGQTQMVAAEISLQLGRTECAKEHAAIAVELLAAGNMNDFHGLEERVNKLKSFLDN